MEKEKKVFIFVAVLFAVVVIIGLLIGPSVGLAEKGDPENPVRMYVTASILNGRAAPSKRSTVEARFDQNDILDAWEWSEKHHWIKVTGGETGTVWVYWEYVTERLDDSRWWNGSGKRIKIRKRPFGTVIGYLDRDDEILVDRIVFGWGHCSRGWVDLSYLEEEL